MEKIELKPCPFCGASISAAEDLQMLRRDLCVVSHFCVQPFRERRDGSPAVVVEVYGSTETEAVDRWNTRARGVKS